MLLFSSHTEWISSDEAFLFSLRNGVGSAFKMAIKEGKQWEAMFSRIVYGPHFGSGWDLHIADNCHTNTMSSSNPGRTYQLPGGYTHKTPQAKSLLAGSLYFTCDDYEVFMLQ